MTIEMDRILPFELEHLFSFRLDIGELEVLGPLAEGLQAHAYIAGGEVDGPKVKGRICPVGGNWAVIGTDGVSRIDYRLTIKSNDGALIYVNLKGLSDFGPDAYNQYFGAEGSRGAGDDLPPIRRHHTGGRCRSAHADYQWLNRVYCVGIGQFDADAFEVFYNIYAIVE